VIYWKYLDFEPPRSREIAALFSAVSGYALELTPYAAGFAGYKDWFIQDFNRPGYTVEAGKGVNPLPIGDFNAIYRRCRPILTMGLLAG
jgi:g-D-glutamyl-meso-diaminopimelate peptidase